MQLLPWKLATDNEVRNVLQQPDFVAAVFQVVCRKVIPLINTGLGHGFKRDSVKVTPKAFFRGSLGL